MLEVRFKQAVEITHAHVYACKRAKWLLRGKQKLGMPLGVLQGGANGRAPQRLRAEHAAKAKLRLMHDGGRAGTCASGCRPPKNYGSKSESPSTWVGNAWFCGGVLETAALESVRGWA